MELLFSTIIADAFQSVRFIHFLSDSPYYYISPEARLLWLSERSKAWSIYRDLLIIENELSTGNRIMFSTNGEVIFGKHKGKHISDLDEEYLRLIQEGNLKTIKIIKDELDRRRAIEEADETLSERIISTGFRLLSKEGEYQHPDLGGDTKKFQALNDAKALLREMLKTIEREDAPVRGFGS